MSNNVDQGPVWLITGGTSGFGLAITKAALAAGARVMAVGLEQLAEQDRAGVNQNRLATAALDVRDGEQVAGVVTACVEKFGCIDVLVNNAGYSLFGALEEVPEADGRRQFEVNFFGVLAMTRATLAHMRKQRSGLVVNISSVGGFDGAACFSYYSASKFAVEGFSESLAKEVESFNIKVMIVEPSSMRTNFRGSSMAFPKAVIEDYDAVSGPIREKIQAGNGSQPGDPNKAAQVLVKVAQSPDRPLRLPLGPEAFRRIRTKLANVEADLKKWEAAAIDIDFPS